MFECNVKVKGYEIDSFGHLNNAVYLNYTEHARWEILEKTDSYEFFKLNGLMLVVVDAHIRFMKEAKIFDELTITTTVKKELPYLVFKHNIYDTRSNQKLSKATIKTLLINEERIPYDLPDEFYIKFGAE